MEKKELETIYDSRKSFYGKAKVEVEQEEDTYTLYSYDTKICDINKKNRTATRYWCSSSPTTTRHIKEFFRQYGGGDLNIEDYKKLGTDNQTMCF